MERRDYLSERLSTSEYVNNGTLAFPIIRGTGGFRKARWGRGASVRTSLEARDIV